MYVGGTFSNIVNKEPKTVYSTRTNHSKAFHYRIANMTKITKTDKSKLKNLVSIPFKHMSLTGPIGDGYRILCLQHCHSK
ncbi:hypothetical protein HU200_026947 [Digitaria exilis]|uniref:Uncharacterized protein n=1 Tax=Digitaria exilis TaxID=1010633 RepID=A0A835C2V9_9POAL|nr:hypothetical protein HU200_026947 [Digitaria exilis]